MGRHGPVSGSETLPLTPMSKRALRKYLDSQEAETLREQLLELYERLPQVKTYYNFVFKPDEEALIRTAREKIRKEYQPRGRRRPKARRSVAQKFIRQYQMLGMEPTALADLMGFNLETALRYAQDRNCPETFYRSMLNSFDQWLVWLVREGLVREFEPRIRTYVRAVETAGWPNRDRFADRLNTVINGSC